MTLNGDRWERVVFRTEEKIAWNDVRATMRGARMYIVLVAAPERANLEDARARAFFESFAIVPE